jgi:Cytochrome c554 and c-prime
MKRGRRIPFAVIVIGAVFCFGGWYSMKGQNQVTKPGAFSRWRPTRELAGALYVGNQVCFQCHKEKALTELANSMARAAEIYNDCSSLKSHQNLTFTNGPYSYRLERKGPRNLYVVSDGQRELAVPILFCFGEGRLGQTYILEHEGTMYESRVSYYRDIGKLDFTILHPHSQPASLVDALGRPLTPEAAKGCFSCHTTGAVHNGQLQIDHLVPGVGCEACHGPGERHVAAMKARDVNDLKIFPPASIDGDELSQELCGACHRSFEDVLALPGQDGINNIRYQPYRIFNSPGHRGDQRISCIACHNPHDRLEWDVSFYDAKCLACHLTKTNTVKSAARSAPACPASNNKCVSCHMQKIDLPGAHGTFTDHWIRVIRAGQPIPR